jgi:hypothetical protein
MRFLQNLRRGFKWICFQAGFSRDGQVARRACHDRLEVGRFTGSAEAMPKQPQSVKADRRQRHATQ